MSFLYYLSQILNVRQSILRELGEQFTFPAFMTKMEIQKKNFNPAQIAGLEQRLSLLTSFLDTDPLAKKKKEKLTPRPRFSAGQLTIIDLSDPFLDAASACGLFEIIVRLFIRADVQTGKVLVVDEAHKVCRKIINWLSELTQPQYLSSDRSATGLTKALLTLIRQQRHLGMRVIISTQGKSPFSTESFLL